MPSRLIRGANGGFLAAEQVHIRRTMCRRCNFVLPWANFTRSIRRAMDIASVKLTLMERLMLVWDEASLRRIGTAIETEITKEVGMDDYSEEEVAELDRRQARHLSGDSKSYAQEEAMRMMREGFKE